MSDDRIYILKLTSDEDIIGEVLDDNDFYVNIKNPVRIAIALQKGQPSVGFQPFPMFSDEQEKVFPIAKLSVVYSYRASQEFIDNYKQIFSGLIVPQTQKIVTHHGV
jgi:hypothetical protein